MDSFEVNPFKYNNPAYLHSIRDEIDMDPVYQRQGEVWSIYKRQLLIDSILNDFDLPKIYVHEYSQPRVDSSGARRLYALVDGKQRLGAIFSFMENQIPLADDFVLYRNPDAKLGGMTFNELAERYPAVIARFKATSLPVQIIRTDDVELIEEMFSRLNEAVPLNAPEKRNAFKGPAPAAARAVAQHAFFTEKLPFSNSRYRHLDLAAKFLLWEDDWAAGNEDKIKDVKKRQLDDFFRELHRSPSGNDRAKTAARAAGQRLTELQKTFLDADRLLQSVGMVSVYYILMQDRELNGDSFPRRSTLEAFDQHRREDLARDDDVLTRGHIALLEFNRLAQSPNDNGALIYRFQVLDTYARAVEADQNPLDAIGVYAPEQRTK